MTTATPSAAPAPVRPQFVRDTRNVFVRELRPTLRDPFQIVFGIIQPLVFLALFGPLLIGTSNAPTSEVLQWFVPGILVMTVLFSMSFTGSNLLFEMQTGAHERTLVAPLSRSALLAGRSLKEMVPLASQVVVITAATIPFGFRPDPIGMVVGLVMIVVLGIGLGSLSYALALASKGRDWLFWTVQQTVLFPLLLLSGVLLPLENGPGWMQALAAVNPMSYVVTAERELFAGEITGSSVVSGFAAAAAVCAIGLVLGIRGMRRAD